MNENTQGSGLENTAQITNTSPQNTQTTQIAGAIILAGIIIAGAIMLKGSSAGPAPSANVNDRMEPTALTARSISSDDHIIGNPKAKIVILEYSDLDCPFCQKFHSTMKQVVADNSDVAWVYRHYPIPQLHPDATKKAEATECAWEQGGNDAFWAYTDKLFEVKYTLSELSNVAQTLGLDVNTFNTCLSSGRYASKVQADVEDGQKMGVNGTPASFILKAGKVVDEIGGNQPYATVIQQLKAVK